MLPNDMENLRAMATDNGRQTVDTAAGPQQPPIAPRRDGLPQDMQREQAVPQQPIDRAMPDDGSAGTGGPGQQMPGDQTEAIQQEFNRGMKAVAEAFYNQEGLSDKIIGMVSEEEKIGSAAKAVITAITQIDKQLDLAERVLAPMVPFMSDMLVEMVEVANPKLEYSETETKQVISAATELLLQAYNVSPERAAEAGVAMSEKDMVSVMDDYEELLNA